MRKPELPLVNEAAWKKEYKPSGICPPSTRFLLLFFGPLLGAAIGVVGYYGGFLTSSLANIVVKFFTFAGLCGGIFSWIGLALSLVAIILFIGLGYPALLGFSISYSIFLIAKIGKCRNPNLTAWIGFLSGAIAYGVFAGLAIHSGGLHETSHLTKLLPNLSITSGWMIFFVILDAIILITVAAAFAMEFISNNPFCETCLKWYGKAIKASYSVEFYDMQFASELVRMLESGTAVKPKKAVRLPLKTDNTRITLCLRRCACNQTDYELTTTLYWQDSHIEKGEHYYSKDTRVIENKDEQWFKTMVPPGLGRQLEAALLSDPAPEEL